MSDPVIQPDHPNRPTPAARVLGWLLTLLGGLWVLLTGGCTLALITTMAGEFGRSSGGVQALGLYLVIGAVCTAPGAGLLIWGLALLRRKRRERNAGD